MPKSLDQRLICVEIFRSVPATRLISLKIWIHRLRKLITARRNLKMVKNQL